MPHRAPQDLQDIKLLPFIGAGLDVQPPPDAFAWKYFGEHSAFWRAYICRSHGNTKVINATAGFVHTCSVWYMYAVCWDKCVKRVECCILGGCKCRGPFKHYTRCCCRVWCRVFFVVVALIAFAVAFATRPACSTLAAANAPANVSVNVFKLGNDSMSHEPLLAFLLLLCKYLSPGVLVVMAVLACCILVSVYWLRVDHMCDPRLNSNESWNRRYSWCSNCTAC